MGETFSFIIAGCSILFFIFGTVLSIKNYKFRFKEEYSFKNHFPFEVNYEGKFFDNLFGNTLYLFSTLFLLVFFATFDTSHTNGMAIFALIAGCFSAVLNATLYFVPLKHLRTHVALSTFQFAFAFMLSAAGFMLNLFYWNQNKSYFNLVAAIITGVVGLAVLLLVLNPKLSLRVVGEEVKDENGEIRITRPKWIIYGFTEWLVIFSLYLNTIPIILYLMSIV